MTAGQLIREARARSGLTQARLARRAGTRQSAISRLENDEVSPTIETLELLMTAMGERLVLSSSPSPMVDDPLHREDWMERTPEERFRLAMSWNKLATRLEMAGREAVSAGGKK